MREVSAEAVIERIEADIMSPGATKALPVDTHPAPI
jgi:hypothetical protein